MSIQTIVTREKMVYHFNEMSKEDRLEMINSSLPEIIELLDRLINIDYREFKIKHQKIFIELCEYNNSYIERKFITDNLEKIKENMNRFYGIFLNEEIGLMYEEMKKYLNDYKKSLYPLIYYIQRTKDTEIYEIYDILVRKINYVYIISSGL